MKKDSFDDIVRKKALDHEAPVPPGTWEAIARKKKKRKRYPLFWWIAGVSLLLGTASLFYIKQYEVKSKGIANETLNKQYPGNHNPAQPVYEKDVAEKNNKPGSGTPVETVGAAIKKQEELSSPVAVKPVKEKAGERSLSALSEEKPAIITGSLQGSIIKNDAVASSPVSKESDKSDMKLHNGQYSYSRPKSKTKASSSPGSVATLPANKETVDASFNTGNLSLSSDYFKRGRTVEFITTIKKIVPLPGTDSLMLSRIDSVNNIIAQMTASAVKKSLKKDKWAVDISVTPFLPLQQSKPVLYLTRTNTGNMEKSEYKTDKMRTRLEPSVSYAISIHRKINQRLRLGIGLQYAMIKEKVDLTGQETRTTYHAMQRLVTGSSGPQLIQDTVATTSYGLLTIDALNSYRLLSVPVSLQYDLLKNRRWSLQLNGGLLATISGKYHNKIQGKLLAFDSQGMHAVKQNSGNIFDLFAGLRFSKNYGSFRLFAEPVLRYNISGYDLDAMINRKSIHQAGLSLGITYLVGH